MVKVKAPRVPITDVTTASAADYTALMKACAPFSKVTDARDAALNSLL